MEKHKYYVYVYCDPRKTGEFRYCTYQFNVEPFYVGKGSGERESAHMRPTHLKIRSPRSSKIKAILSAGKKPVIVRVRSGLTDEQSLAEEVNAICAIGRIDLGTGPLTNMSDGGTGSGKSAATIAKQKASLKAWFAEPRNSPSRLGSRNNPDSLRKMVETRKARGNYKWTDRQRQSRRAVKPNTTMNWLVTSPEGRSHIVFGLREFCQQNHLAQPAMHAVAKGLRSQHKGWRCQIVNESTDAACGMGIREDVSPITGNASRFVPHLF